MKKITKLHLIFIILILLAVGVITPLLVHNKNYAFSSKRLLILDTNNNFTLTKDQLEAGLNNDLLANDNPLANLIKFLTRRKITIIDTAEVGGSKRYVGEVSTLFNIKIGRTEITGKIDQIE